MKRVFGLILAFAIGFLAYRFYHSRSGGLSLLTADPKLSVAFTSFVHSVRGIQRIQLAEINSVEVIERTSENSIFWDFLKLPEMVVQARVPVRYVYFVDMQEPFEITHDGRGMRVLAPALRSGMPAPDVSAISYEVKEGNFFRNPRTAFEELRKTITPLLKESSERNRDLVFDEARRQLGALVKMWMLQSPELKTQVDRIDVKFQNEKAPVQ